MRNFASSPSHVKSVDDYVARAVLRFEGISGMHTAGVFAMISSKGLLTRQDEAGCARIPSSWLVNAGLDRHASGMDWLAQALVVSVVPHGSSDRSGRKHKRSSGCPGFWG